ncbi:MAG TPA: flagellar export chaperone FlgN [Tepidisphaeraceae bacterium]|jgi:hypothetical protein|nr:flagellar export chaperone FlgN [Tepidisphaeraceae bacterium]
MSRQVSELETILQQLIAEHRKLLVFLQTQQVSMKLCDLKKMDDTAIGAEACRLRIVSADQRRRLICGQIAAQMKFQGALTIAHIAAAFPARAETLMKLRAELKSVAEQVKTKSYIAGRVAGAVLGHLNTVVRLVSGAVGKAGVYTKRGVPRMTNRIGVMEAVG